MIAYEISSGFYFCLSFLFRKPPHSNDNQAPATTSKSPSTTSTATTSVEKARQREETRLFNESVDALAERLRPVLEAVKAHKFAGPFLAPVTASEAPGYFNIITFPIGKWLFFMFISSLRQNPFASRFEIKLFLIAQALKLNLTELMHLV
ncbi:unnamed protein product [Hydatigera taeniaeformis]|uniref:tRNA-synt_2 domain-containing protein n=1 Tax=Hydatigena taeniaeformis TaxID=6205 RepID=A0A0R3WX70_HYDTA|nr:unnamed protein product [Hydatigera taeniaeformis]